MPNSNNGKTQLVPIQHMVGACLHAAYFMDGMSGSAQQLYDWRERTNTGHVDMVSELAVHAIMLAELEEKGAEVVDGIYPGVFDYEVSESFGKWFALQCITNDSMPTDEEARQYLAAETYSFFSQGPVDDKTRAHLRKVLGIKVEGKTAFQPVKLIIEAYDTSPNDVISPAYLAVTVDDWLIGELKRLFVVVKDNGLDTASIGINMLIKWNLDEVLHVGCNELVVNGDGAFWFTGFPNDRDYSVESRAIQIDKLEAATYGKYSDGFWSAGDGLYFSTGMPLQDLVDMVKVSKEVTK